MIVGIGCDIVEHDMTKILNWESDTSILNRIFTEAELDIYYSQKQLCFLAGRFAAKEAVLKCLATGMQDGIKLPDIQILPVENGKPRIELFGQVKEIADKMEINVWHISITHSSKHSMAVAIAEKI